MTPDLAKLRERLGRLLATLDQTPDLVEGACVVFVMRVPDEEPGNLDCVAAIAVKGAATVLAGVLEDVSEGLLGGLDDEDDEDQDEDGTEVRPN